MESQTVEITKTDPEPGSSKRTSIAKMKVHNPPQLFRDLSKEIRRAERLMIQANPPKPERESKRIKKRPAFDDFIIDFTDFKKGKFDKKVYGIDEVDDIRRENIAAVTTSNEEIKAENSPGCSRDITKSTKPPNYGNWKRTKCSELKVVLTKTLKNAQISSSKDESIYDFVDEETEEISGRFYSERPSTSSPQNYITSSSMSTPVGASDINQKNDGQGELEISNIEVEVDTEPLVPNKSTRAVPSSDDDISRSIHQDDDFIYLSLEESSLDNEEEAGQRDKSWNPKSKVANVHPKHDRPSRQGTQKRSFGKVLEAAAAKLVNTPAVPEMPLVVDKPAKTPPGQTKTPAQTTTPKAPRSRKKLYTAKQRLGKILKLHKMRH